MFYLDIQRGLVRTENGNSVALSSDDMSVLYWCALGAPDNRIASAIYADAAYVGEVKKRLAERIGVPASELGRLSVRIANGHWPRTAAKWQDRHAGTLISRGLDRPDDQILAYVAGEGALTVGEIKSLVSRLRAGLRAQGVEKGNWVAIDSTQRIESYLLAIAILMEGAAIVRIGDNIGPTTLLSLVRAAPSVMTFSSHLDVLGGEPSAGSCVSLDAENAHGFPSFSEWFAACPEDADPNDPPANLAPTDVAVIGFTSGSTGEPTAVRNSHEAIWRTSEAATHLFDLGPDDVFMTATDFVALSAFRSMLTLPMLSGGRVVFPSAKARTDPFAQALECETYAVSCLTAVPNVLRGLVKAADRLAATDLSALRVVLSGCGVLDAETAKAFHERFGLATVDYYGQRETATLLYTLPGEATTMSTHGGRASENLIRMLDDAGRPVDAGEIGEITVQTDCKQVEKAQPIAREPQDPDRAGDGADPHHGWHRTGDLAFVGADGKVVVAGRKRDIIKTPDGQLLSPIEVENILIADPQISEGIVFPFHRNDGVERVGAAVLCTVDLEPEKTDALEEKLQWNVRDQLGAYKAPDRILILNEFPRVGRGKPDRKALLSAFLERFDE